jgi:hypothetical protein
MLLPIFSIGQFDTTKFYRSPNVGEIFRRAKINALMLPGDTTTNKVGIAQIGGVLYSFGSGKWNAIGSADTTILASKAFTNATYALRNRAIVAGYGLAGGGDLSADRSFIVDSTVIASKPYVDAGLATKQNTLTNPITGTGVSGRVPFYTGTTTLNSDTAFRWDNTNKRLGVNITPLDRVHIGANKINSLSAPDAVGLIVQDLTSSTIGVGGAIQFRGFHNALAASTVSGVINTIKENATNGDFSFAMGFHTRLNGNSQWPERARITSDGNLLINTSTNAGFRADINGTARIVSKLTQPTTANSPKGTATLVNGVVTVNNTLATTGCFIQVNYRAGTALSGTSSILTVSSLVNATSFTVTAYNAGAVTTNTSDNNTIEYTISN